MGDLGSYIGGVKSERVSQEEGSSVRSRVVVGGTVTRVRRMNSLNVDSSAMAQRGIVKGSGAIRDGDVEAACKRSGVRVVTGESGKGPHGKRLFTKDVARKNNSMKGQSRHASA